MSERQLRTGERPRSTITHDEAINDPALRAQYVDERLARIKAKESVWMIRNFELSSGKERGFVMDYYYGGGLGGFIDGNDLDGYFVYGLALEQGERPHQLGTEPVANLSEAQKSLEVHVRETYPTQNT